MKAFGEERESEDRDVDELLRCAFDGIRIPEIDRADDGSIAQQESSMEVPIEGSWRTGRLARLSAVSAALGAAASIASGYVLAQRTIDVTFVGLLPSILSLVLPLVFLPLLFRCQSRSSGA